MQQCDVFAASDVEFDVFFSYCSQAEDQKYFRRLLRLAH